VLTYIVLSQKKDWSVFSMTSISNMLILILNLAVTDTGYSVNAGYVTVANVDAGTGNSDSAEA
jgi:hypothetical protein